MSAFAAFHIQSSDALMTTGTVDICGLVVSLALSQLLFLFFSFRRTFHPRYAWCLTYFMGTHRDVYIVLKRSLKWVPIVGWVCTKKNNQSDCLPPLFFCCLVVLTLVTPSVIWHQPIEKDSSDHTETEQMCIFTGNAILQLYLFGAFVGVR